MGVKWGNQSLHLLYRLEEKARPLMAEKTFNEKTLRNVLAIQKQVFESYTGQTLPEELHQEVMAKLEFALRKGPLSNKQGEQVIQRAVQSYKDRKGTADVG